MRAAVATAIALWASVARGQLLVSEGAGFETRRSGITLAWQGAAFESSTLRAAGLELGLQFPSGSVVTGVLNVSAAFAGRVDPANAGPYLGLALGLDIRPVDVDIYPGAYLAVGVLLRAAADFATVQMLDDNAGLRFGPDIGLALEVGTFRSFAVKLYSSIWFPVLRANLFGHGLGTDTQLQPFARVGVLGTVRLGEPTEKKERKQALDEWGDVQGATIITLGFSLDRRVTAFLPDTGLSPPDDGLLLRFTAGVVYP